MTEYEIYVMPERKFWKAGEKGKPAALPSGIDGAGVGASVSLDEFIEQMKSTIEKAIQPGDSVVYKQCAPPWWDPLLESRTQGLLIPSKIEVEHRYIREVLTSARTDLQKHLWMKEKEKDKQK